MAFLGAAFTAEIAEHAEEGSKGSSAQRRRDTEKDSSVADTHN
jgi:hypothetical protein